MATPTITPRRSSGGGLKIHASIAGLDRTQRDLASARRDIRQRVKVNLLKVAERYALPTAKQLVTVRTGKTRGSLTARGTTSGAYLTTSLRGKAGRYVGLIEWGGTVQRGDDAPRVYEGKLFLNNAVYIRRRQIDAASRLAIQEAFDSFETDL